MSAEPAKVAQYELEIAIDAPPDRVWSALTEETNAWWLPDFHMVGEGSVVRFEAHAGGRLIEELEGGGSLLWYTVTMAVPGESLHLVGFSAPEWGGPSTSMLKLALEGHGDGTLLRVSDALFGRISDSHLASLREGWEQLFGGGLKPYAEKSR